MLKRIHAVWMVLIGLSAASGGLAAGQTGSEVDELIAYLTPIQQYQAKFVQVTLNAADQVLDQSTGSLVAQRPNRFFWQTLPPNHQEIISNGRRIWIIDHDLEQVTERPLDSDVAHVPLLLFSGQTQRIKSAFNVHIQDAPQPDVTRFELHPKNQQALFSHLEVRFQNGRLIELQLYDHLDQRTQLQFSALQTPLPALESLFEPKIPSHYDFIQVERSEHKEP